MNLQLETNLGRIEAAISKLSQFNATPGKGCTRFSYSQEDSQAKEYLLKEFYELGLEVTVDAVGNIRARLEGEDQHGPTVATGSHIDTVLHGGNYDGVVGVVGALEAVRVIVENKISVKSPIEIIVFVEEEGSNFGMTTVGSKAMIGKYTLEDLKNLKSGRGVSLYQTAVNCGLNPDTLGELTIKPGEIKAMIELHIEQGGQLESAGVSIGIVEVIAGIKVVDVKFEGVSNHAGATQMHLRKDPLVSAAKMIIAVEDIAKNQSLPSTVGTVGRVVCFPNVANVIPGKVTCTLDIRDVNPDGIGMAYAKIEKAVRQIAEEDGLNVQVEVVGEVVPIWLSEKVSAVIEGIAAQRKIDYLRLNSGAIHDACLLANITEVGMIFIPSIKGRSHVPEERTDINDIKLGCDLLLEAIVKLANS